MELTSLERMTLELLQEKDDQAFRESQQRMMRFVAGVSERTGIPADMIRINQQTGAITDARITAGESAASDEPPVDGHTHESRPVRRSRKRAAASDVG